MIPACSLFLLANSSGIYNYVIFLYNEEYCRSVDYLNHMEEEDSERKLTFAFSRCNYES